MNFISFHRLKLFKGPTPRPANGDKEAPVKKEKKRFGRRFFQSPILYWTVFVLGLSYLLSYAPPRSLPRLSEGQIAPTDLVSPLDLNIEDTETTAKRKAEAEEAVLPVYTLDESSFLSTEESVRQLFEFGREWLKNATPPVKAEQLQKAIAEKFELELPGRELDSLLRSNFSVETQETLISLIGKVSSRGIIVSKSLFIRQEPERGFVLTLGPANERLVRVDEVLDLPEAKEQFAAEAGRLQIPSRNRQLLIGLADLLLRPNVSFNRTETEARTERARQRVETVYYRMKKGKVILRKGDEATAETLKWISIINENLREAHDWIVQLVGTFLLFALFLLTVWYYLKSLLKFRAALTHFNCRVTLVLGLLVYKLGSCSPLFSARPPNCRLTEVEVFRFLPYQFGVLIFAFLTTNTVTLIFAVLNSLLVGYIFQGNFQLMLYAFVGGLAAVYGVRYYKKQRRTSVLRSGLFVVAPINVFLIITLQLIQARIAAPDRIAAEAVMGLLGGTLSAALAFVLLPIFEIVFGFVTQTKLVDLTNSDLPIFAKWPRRGSYHHSLVVATLPAAEKSGWTPCWSKPGPLP
jgi:membrane-associated HD superfamily phosphohydrolase